MCGFATLSQIMIYFCVCICDCEDDKIKRREEITKKLEENLVEVSGNSGNCSICLIRYKVGEKCYCLSCGHIFHVNCLEDWLKVKLRCPLCRKKLNHEEEEGLAG